MVPTVEYAHIWELDDRYLVADGDIIQDKLPLEEGLEYIGKIPGRVDTMIDNPEDEVMNYGPGDYDAWPAHYTWMGELALKEVIREKSGEVETQIEHLKLLEESADEIDKVEDALSPV